MLDKNFSPPGQTTFAARYEAQKIAFGPMVFQCVRYAWKRGMLGDWPTLYQAMAQLPEPARSSRFAFDHHYSDTSFADILPDVFATAPRRLVDIGANTGKFSCAGHA
ncbi:MAG: hypothetical protein V4754_05905 [Pseudomonadota bacterium]